jgi:LAO/AO transport system kinase
MGDDIQAIKAGILEVADVFCVNKSDLDGSDRVVRELRQMLELRHAVKAPPPALEHDAAHRFTGGAAAPPAGPEEWEPPILKAVAAKGEGVAELLDGIDRHQAFLERSGQRRARDRTRAATQFVALLRERLLASALRRLERERGRLDEVASRIADRQADPYELADALARQLSE